MGQKIDSRKNDPVKSGWCSKNPSHWRECQFIKSWEARYDGKYWESWTVIRIEDYRILPKEKATLRLNSRRD